MKTSSSNAQGVSFLLWASERWGGLVDEIRPVDVIQEHFDGKVDDWIEKVSDEQYHRGSFDSYVQSSNSKNNYRQCRSANREMIDVKYSIGDTK